MEEADLNLLVYSSHACKSQCGPDASPSPGPPPGHPDLRLRVLRQHHHELPFWLARQQEARETLTGTLLGNAGIPSSVRPGFAYSHLYCAYLNLVVRYGYTDSKMVTQ